MTTLPSKPTTTYFWLRTRFCMAAEIFHPGCKRTPFAILWGCNKYVCPEPEVGCCWFCAFVFFLVDSWNVGENLQEEVQHQQDEWHRWTTTVLCANPRVSRTSGSETPWSSFYWAETKKSKGMQQLLFQLWKKKAKWIGALWLFVWGCLFPRRHSIELNTSLESYWAQSSKDSRTFMIERPALGHGFGGVDRDRFL